ncbi:hypothetical protein [Nonomuraea sp. NPDC003214]
MATRQWGFIASALAYGLLYGRNYLAWRSTPEPERASGHGSD